MLSAPVRAGRDPHPLSVTVRPHGTRGMLVQYRVYAHIVEGQTDGAEVATVMFDIKNTVKTHAIIFAAEQSALDARPVRLPLPV